MGNESVFVLPRKENSSERDALSHNYQKERKTQTSDWLFGGQLFLMDFKWNCIWAWVPRPSSIGHFFKQLHTSTCSPFLQPLIHIDLPVIAYCHSSLSQQQHAGANKTLLQGFYILLQSKFRPRQHHRHHKLNGLRRCTDTLFLHHEHVLKEPPELRVLSQVKQSVIMNMSRRL